MNPGRVPSATIPVANTDRRPMRRGNSRVFKGLCLPHANLRDCTQGPFRALNGAPSLFGRTSSNSVRSDFSSSFQCPEFQLRQNFGPRVHSLRGEQSGNTREAQPLGALAEWRVAVAVVDGDRFPASFAAWAAGRAPQQGSGSPMFRPLSSEKRPFSSNGVARLKELLNGVAVDACVRHQLS